MNAPGIPLGYRNTQAGYWHWLMIFMAIGVVALGYTHPEEGPLWVFFLPSGVLIFFASLFATLTVEDDDDALLLEFGPLNLCRKRIPYDEMNAVSRTRSRFIDGWGVRYRLGHGWMFNIWGYDCIEIRRGEAKPFFVGTNDPQGLLDFLEAKLGSPAVAPAA